jgi:hypothetical protein
MALVIRLVKLVYVVGQVQPLSSCCKNNNKNFINQHSYLCAVARSEKGDVWQSNDFWNT